MVYTFCWLLQVQSFVVMLPFYRQQHWLILCWLVWTWQHDFHGCQIWALIPLFASDSLLWFGIGWLVFISFFVFSHNHAIQELNCLQQVLMWVDNFPLLGKFESLQQKISSLYLRSRSSYNLIFYKTPSIPASLGQLDPLFLSCFYMDFKKVNFYVD